MRVRLSAAVPSGRYSIVVGVSRRPKARPSQRITYTLTIPAAALATTQPLVITRTTSVLGIGGDVVAEELILRETSKRSRLTNLTVDQVGQALGPAGPSDGRLAFDVPDEIAPGGTGEASVQLDEDFDLGTADGTVIVDATELTSPTTVPFQVRTSRPGWLILVVALVGLFLGYLTRVLLQQRIERAEALNKAADVKRELEQELKEQRDETFRKNLEAAEEDLRPAFARFAGPERVTRAVNAATTSLETARKEFAERRTSALGKQKELEQLLERPWRLPPAVSTTLEEARTEGATARDLLAAGDIKNAAAAQQRATDLVVKATGPQANDWRTAAESAVDTLAGSASIPADVAKPLGDAAEAARQRLTAVSNAAKEGSAAVLNALNDAFKTVTRVVNLLTRIEETVHAVGLELDGLNLDTSEPRRFLRTLPPGRPR